MTKEYDIGIWKMNMFRLIWRTSYVIIATLVAMIFPFFNSIVGLLGALSFFPLTVYFPIEMYLVQAKVPKYSHIWIGMKFLSVFCLIVSLVAAVGSVEGIISDLKTYKPFMSS
jgi:inner membrane protein involved in colicin E2 resistance